MQLKDVAVIITGGPDYFSAGADLREVPSLMSEPGSAVEYMTLWRRFHETIETLGKPVVAAIEGFCLTGGFELAPARDLRVGARGRAASVAWLALNPVEREDYRKAGCLEAEPAAAGIVRRLIWPLKAGHRSRIPATPGDHLAAIPVRPVPRPPRSTAATLRQKSLPRRVARSASAIKNAGKRRFPPRDCSGLALPRSLSSHPRSSRASQRRQRCAR